MTASDNRIAFIAFHSGTKRKENRRTPHGSSIVSTTVSVFPSIESTRVYLRCIRIPIFGETGRRKLKWNGKKQTHFECTRWHWKTFPHGASWICIQLVARFLLRLPFIRHVQHTWSLSERNGTEPNGGRKTKFENNHIRSGSLSLSVNYYNRMNWFLSVSRSRASPFTQLPTKFKLC